jgi:Flp pilus assembly pilin Flp
VTARLRRLGRDRSGASLVEFALAAPLLILFLVGIAQMGSLYFASAGLKNLVAEGARFASLSPRPTDAAIRARLMQGGFGLETARLTQPTIAYGRTNGADYAEIQMTYQVQLDFIFWRPAPTTLTQRRRVFIYPAA